MSHWNPAEWSTTPCWCNGCHVCGYNGRAPKPVIVVEDVPQPTLFDEPPARPSQSTQINQGCRLR